MPRIRFTVAYDGRPYAGWQIQPNAPTVQATLQQALAIALGSPTTVHGSGRTDAGVHAWGQVFHIETERASIPENRWPAALNARLPHTIRILDARYVPDDFHARFSATSKTYCYKIRRTPFLNPFEPGLIWHCPRPMDESVMEDCLGLLQGEHDFRAFAALRGNEPTPLPDSYFVRTIYKTSFSKEEDCLTLTFTGSGFLYKMVRLMIGGLYTAAVGKITRQEFKRLLNTPSTGDKSPLCAPPDGLYLMQVYYGEE